MVKTRELAEQIEKYGYFRVSRKRPRVRLTIFTPDEGFARRLADEEGRKLYTYDYEEDARRYYAVPFEVKDTVRLVTRCQFHFCPAHKQLAVNLAWLAKLNKAVKSRAWSAHITGFRVHAYQAAVAERDGATSPILDYIASGALFRDCPKHEPYIKKTPLTNKTEQCRIEPATSPALSECAAGNPLSSHRAGRSRAGRDRPTFERKETWQRLTIG